MLGAKRGIMMNSRHFGVSYNEEGDVQEAEEAWVIFNSGKNNTYTSLPPLDSAPAAITSAIPT